MNSQPIAPQTCSEIKYFLFALLLGLIVGLIGSLFHFLADRLLTFFSGLEHLPSHWLTIAASVALTALLTLASAWIVRKVAPEAAGSGIQEIEGAMEGLRPLRWARVLIAKFTAGVLSLGAGLVLGREGPTIHMGAASAEGICQRFNIIDRDRKGLLAAGAAAGLAAAFNAPLAGVLFVVEETRRQFPYGFRTYMAVIIASITAAIVVENIGGAGPFLLIDVPVSPLIHLPAFVVLGCALGALGVFFNWAVLKTLDAFQALGQIGWWIAPLGVGAIIGFFAIWLPQTVHGGESLIEVLIHEKHGVMLLLALTAFRIIGVLISYASGVPGGIFAPMLSIATCAGLAFGTALVVFFPDAQHMPASFAIAAMGGLFAASVRAPIVGVVLVLELTGAYQQLLPVMVTCVCATLVAHKLGGRPIYEQLLERTLRLAGKTPPAPSDFTPAILGFDEAEKSPSPNKEI